MVNKMKNEIILFENQEVKLEVNMKDETVWLTQTQMAQLFDRDVKTISKHIKNAFDEELDEKSNSQKMRIANSDKLVHFYNLDVIIYKSDYTKKCTAQKYCSATKIMHKYQRCYDRGKNKYNSAHSGSSLLFLVPRGSVFKNGLTKLQFP